MAEQRLERNLAQKYEALLKRAIGLDDTFRFHCNECGQCCKNREDILLSPYDLYRIAGLLGLEPGLVIQDYCIWYIGQTSKLPVVAVNMKGPEKVCPFLEGSKCRIHAAKPTVCALFPLGRAGCEEGIRYIVQDTKYGTRDEEHTVREWLAEFNLEDSEAWFDEWQKALVPLTLRMRTIASSVSEKSLDMVAQGLLVALYVHYERGGDFMEQFRENVRKIDGLLATLEGAVKDIRRTS